MGMRGASLVEVMTYASLLGVLGLALFSTLNVTLKAERHVAEDGSAQDDADRVLELVGSELRAASLSTLAEPGPLAAGDTARFRRVVGIAYDATTGIPVPVVEADEVVLRLGAGGLEREQAGKRTILAGNATAILFDRGGLGAAIRVRVEVRRAGVTAAADGRLLILND
jgi:type II secretory pathway component PulJ